MAGSLVTQRWIRPIELEPGALKQLLATKHLKVAATGAVDALHQLLERHPEFLDKAGPHGRTLLWEAVRKDRSDAVRFLVGQGAQVNPPARYSNETRVMVCPYSAAHYYRRDEIAEYLWSNGAELDVFRAAFLDDRPRVERLLKAKPDLLHAEDPFDEVFFTPLIAFAAAGGHHELCGDLMDRGAEVAGYSAHLLNLAGRIARHDLVELLLARGADARAAEAGVLVDISDLATLALLLDRGAPLNEPGMSGFPPIVYMARGDKGGRTDKIKELLDRGADIDATGPKSRTALHCAAAGGLVAVVELLLEHGAKSALLDEDGNTALALARAAGKDAAVEALSKHGARK